MKITLAQATEFLKKIGLPDVEVVEEDKDADFDTDAALLQIDENRSAFIKPKMLDEITTEVKGKQGVFLRDTLSKMTGMGRSKLNAFDTDIDAIKGALSFWESSLGKKPNEMKEEMDALIAAHTETLQKMKNDYEVQLKASNAKYTDRNIDDHFLSIVNSMSLPKDADKKAIAAIVRAQIAGQVDLSYDEEKGQVIALKKGANIPAMNESGTQLFDFSNAALSALKPLGIIASTKKQDVVDATNARGNAATNQQQFNRSSSAVNPSVQQLNEQRAAMFEAQGLSI